MESKLKAYRETIDYNENKTLFTEIKDYIESKGFSEFESSNTVSQMFGVKDSNVPRLLKGITNVLEITEESNKSAYNGVMMMESILWG